MSDRLELSDPKGDAELEKIVSALKAAEQKPGSAKPPPEAANKAPPAKLGARKHASFKAVSTAPSINLTPRGSIMVAAAYPTVQDLSNSVNVAAAVKFNGCPAYLLDSSTQPNCTGDEAGSGGGVRSGTVNGEVKPVNGCTNVRVERKLVVREGDACTMNGGNNPGVYVAVPATSSAPPASALQSSNPPIPGNVSAPDGAGASAGASVRDAKNPLGLPDPPRTPAEKTAAMIRQQSLDGSGALHRDLAMLQNKSQGPSVTASDGRAEATAGKAQEYTRNSLATALLGPLFGAPGAATRIFGGNESQVAAGNEVGAAVMGVGLSLSGIPARQASPILYAEPKIVSMSTVSQPRSAGFKVARMSPKGKESAGASPAPTRQEVSTAFDEMKQLPSLNGKTKMEIEEVLQSREYTSVPAKNGGTVWTKDFPDGNTAAVRLDPPTIRDVPKGFADEVAHAHKEIVFTNNVVNGNYKPGKNVVTLDDSSLVTTDPLKAHIPLK